MRKASIIAFGAAMFVASAAPAYAVDNYVFGSSEGNRWTLTINGNIYRSVDTGWIASNGEHGANNSNYIVGSLGGISYNNWGVFDLSNLRGTITSAILSLDTEDVFNVPLLYTLFDTNASLNSLDANRNPGNANGINLYNDLGSGVSYGSYTYTSADQDLVRSITLNAAALSAISAAKGGQFALGGTSSAVTAAVPEPATWAMLMVGFGAIGYSLRRRRKPVLRVRYN